MKKFMKAIKSATIGGLMTAIASPAFAAVDLTGVSLDVTTVETLVATILVGLGVIWGVRKVIKTVNRS